MGYRLRLVTIASLTYRFHSQFIPNFVGIVDERPHERPWAPVGGSHAEALVGTRGLSFPPWGPTRALTGTTGDLVPHARFHGKPWTPRVGSHTGSRSGFKAGSRVRTHARSHDVPQDSSRAPTRALLLTTRWAPTRVPRRVPTREPSEVS